MTVVDVGDVICEALEHKIIKLTKIFPNYSCDQIELKCTLNYEIWCCYETLKIGL